MLILIASVFPIKGREGNKEDILPRTLECSAVNTCEFRALQHNRFQDKLILVYPEVVDVITSLLL